MTASMAFVPGRSFLNAGLRPAVGLRRHTATMISSLPDKKVRNFLPSAPILSMYVNM